MAGRDAGAAATDGSTIYARKSAAHGRPVPEAAERHCSARFIVNPTTSLVPHRDAPPSGVDGTVRPLPWRPRGSPDRPRRPKGFVVTLEVCADSGV